MTPLELLIVALAAGGVFFGFVAAVGVIRLPDLYTRAHAASKSDTLGAVLSLAAVALVFGADVATVKAVFLVAFMFITNPTAAHAIARAAYDQGIEPWSTEDAEGDTKPTPSTDEADGTGSLATDGSGTDTDGSGPHGSGADTDGSGTDTDGPGTNSRGGER